MIDFSIEKNKKIHQVLRRKGRVHSVQEHYFVSKGPVSTIGDMCVVGERRILCEVVSIEKENIVLFPLKQDERVKPGEWVENISQFIEIPSFDTLLGTVLNATGDVLNKANVKGLKEKVFLDNKPLHAFERKPITDILKTGIKAIDGMLTIGVGQKIGIFAGSGVGKSTLLGMIARTSAADVNVIALVGERGREVQEFIERDLGEEGLKKSVLVVATSDESQMMQIKAAKLATSIAEHFREEGKNVLLMMDSITRFADARRTLDIAAEDFPIGGKTMLMEMYMKNLLERSGKTDKGSITGIYTVLVDGDDMNGPIPDLARGILDGHIILKRDLAVKGHYPAISITDSLSRVMEAVVSEEHQEMNTEVRKQLSIYQENEMYLKMGMLSEEESGNQEVFEAKKKVEQINRTLKQRRDEAFSLEETVELFQKITQSM